MPRFPNTRMRRNRQTDWSRRLIRENHLSVNDLIGPFLSERGRVSLSQSTLCLVFTDTVSTPLLPLS